LSFLNVRGIDDGGCTVFDVRFDDGGFTVFDIIEVVAIRSFTFFHALSVPI
jgi:hypothetical protein